MNLARILYPVKVLGPGNRIGLWLCGCSRGCKGCSNPELWDPRPEYEIGTDSVFDLINKIASAHPVDGFTVSGGEPMDQPEELAKLVERMLSVSEDIIVYTGYRLEELQLRKDRWTDSILRTAAVLVDGEYIERLNDDTLLRGSSNQRVHILNDRYSGRYHRYLAEAHNQIQNFTTSDGIVSVGIHHPTFQEI